MYGPNPIRGRCSIAASSSGSRPPSGPTTAVTSVPNFVASLRSANGSHSELRHDRRPLRARSKAASAATASISGSRARATARPLHAPPRRRATARSACAVVPPHDAAPGSDRRDARHPELGAPGDHGVERARLRERDGEATPAARPRARRTARCAPSSSRPGIDRFDLVAPPRYRGRRPTVTCSPVAQAAHSLEMVTVGAGDLDRVVEVGDERACRRILGRPRRLTRGRLTDGRPTGCARTDRRGAALPLHRVAARAARATRPARG